MNTYAKTVCGVLTAQSDFKIYTVSMLIYNWGWQLSYKNKKLEWNAKQLFHYVQFPFWCAYLPPHTTATSIFISAQSQNQNF